MIVILNARAGTAAKSGNLQSRIAEFFCAAGLNAEIISVAGKDMSAAAKQAVAGNHETIVAGGGDGTVNPVVAEVAGTERVLGVLPLGTLNHFAKDLDLRLDLESAVRTIGKPVGDAFQLRFPQWAYYGSDSALRFTRLASLEKPPEPRRAHGLCTGRLLLDPAHRAHLHLSRSPLSDRRYRRPRGRSLLAGLLVDCIRNLPLATLLNSTFQLEGRRLNGT
jgi:hypothetical protein